jgi:hypothetical protein
MDSFEQTKESVETARAALKAETREVVRVSQHLNDNLVEAVRRIWRQLLFIWVVVIVLAVSYLVILGYTPLVTNLAYQGPPAQPESGMETHAGGLSPAARPPLPGLPESGSLLKLLNQLRDAQYKKDIELFLAAYSPSFPDLGQKREQTLKIWRRFDYLDLQFQITNVQKKNPTTIAGVVTWNMKTRERKTSEIKTVSKAYQVSFANESGAWRIQAIEPLDNKETKSPE